MNFPPEFQPASADDVVDALALRVSDDTLSADAAIGFVQTSMKAQLACMISAERCENVRARISRWCRSGDDDLLAGPEEELRKYRDVIDSFKRVTADLEERLKAD